MIYGRWGQPVEVVRVGTLDDVRELDRREPDEQDRHNVGTGGYVVTRNIEGGKVTLHHLAYLRADDGLPEIMRAVRATMEGGNDATQTTG